MRTQSNSWLLLVLALSLTVAVGCPKPDPDPVPDPDPDTREPVDYVNPLIGAGGEGFGIGAAFPGATTPFGMVRLGPDTAMESSAMGVFHCAGYYYEDLYIEGFSHLHLHGTGVTDYGNVMYMPTLGMDSSKTEEAGYRQAFFHDTEEVSAGYYAVTLDDTDIRVELTATQHAGMQRYTFPASDEAVVILDMAHTLGEGVVDVSEVHLNHDHAEITGMIHNVGEFTSRLGGVDLYFVTQFDKDPVGYGTFEGDSLSEDSGNAEGEDIGAWFRFTTTQDEQILVRTGVSYIDEDHARANLEAELGNTWDFDAVHNGARNQWNDELKVIEVTGGTEDERIIFYTALYHVMMMPTTFTEVGGDYLGFDLNTHYAEEFVYYTDFSLWDTFRTLHPLLVLIDPDRQEDMLVSIEKMLEQGDGLPQWALATGDTGSMIGTPIDQMIAGSYLKGMRGYDIEAMYREMYDHATGPVEGGERGCIEDYVSLGYVPADTCDDSTSRTLEFAYNDYSVALLAQALGHDDDAEELFAQALSYQNIWDAETGFFRGRFADGSWIEPFDPTAFAEDYTEATAWQYRWHAQHDPDGLIGLFGGEEAFVEQLDEFFQMAHDYPAEPMPNQYYWHGNEPDIHAMYLFDQAGRPDLAQKWVRWVMDAKYTTGPDGIAGNDDCGTLSAWYVFSALGFYPVAGTALYLVGSPIFDEAVVHLSAGDLVITAEGAGPDAVYVQDLVLGGSSLGDPWFHHTAISAGGEMTFTMGDSPSTWGQ